MVIVFYYSNRNPKAQALSLCLLPFYALKLENLFVRLWKAGLQLSGVQGNFQEAGFQAHGLVLF